MKYLGLLLGASYKALHISEGVMNKIERHLASRKMYLFKDGRLSLWGGVAKEFKCHLVSWSKVCSSLERFRNSKLAGVQSCSLR